MNKEHAYIDNGCISDDNVAFYEQYGYLIAPDLLSASEIAELKKETAAIFRGERGYVEGMLPVDAHDSDADILKR